MAPNNANDNGMYMLIQAKLRETTEVDIRKQLDIIQEKLKDYSLTVSLKFGDVTIKQLESLKSKANEVSTAVANVSKQQAVAAKDYSNAIKQNIIDLTGMQLAQQRAITKRDAEGNKTVTGFREKYVDNRDSRVYDVTLDANRNQVAVHEIDNIEKIAKLRQQAHDKAVKQAEQEGKLFTRNLIDQELAQQRINANKQQELNLQKQIIDVSRMELLKKTTQYSRDAQGNPQATGSKATYFDPATQKGFAVTLNNEGAQVAATEIKNVEAIQKKWDALQVKRDQQYNKDIESFRKYTQTMLAERERFNTKTYNDELQSFQKQVTAINKEKAKQDALGTPVDHVPKAFQNFDSLNVLMKGFTHYGDTAQVKNFTEGVVNGKDAIQFQVQALEKASGQLKTYYYNLDKTTGILRQLKTVTQDANAATAKVAPVSGTNIGNIDPFLQNRDSIQSHLTSKYITDASSQSMEFGNIKESGDKWSLVAKNINKATKEVTSYNIEVHKATGAVQEVSSTVGQLKEKSNLINFGDKFSNALQSMGVWMSAATVFFGTIRSVQAGVKHIEELDHAMTDLKKVTDETSDTYKAFYMEANAIGGVLGRTTTEVVAATAEFARLGYTLKQSTTLAQEAILYSNVGGMNVQESSQALISAMKGFGIEVDSQGKNVRRITDVYNEVGNNYAISSSGIGEAVKRSASSMREAGNSLEQTVALVAAANSIVQDPEVIGTALKTVSMRIRGVSEDTGVLSEDLPKLENAFSKIGLTLRKDANTFKSTYDIMKELAGVWSSLTDIQHADILEKIAGARQGNVIAGLLNNFKDAQDVLKTGLESAGSVTKEQAKYMESLEFKTAQFQNTLLGFWQTTIDSKSVGNMIELGTSLLKIITLVADKVGLLPILFGALTIAYQMNNKAVVGAIAKLWEWVTTVYASQVAGKGLIPILWSMGTAMAAALAPMLAITVAIWALQKAWTTYQNARQADIDRAKHLQEERIQIDENIKSVTKLAGELEKLEQVSNPTLDQRTKMVDLQKQIADILPKTVKGYTDEGVAIASTTKEIRTQIEELKRLRAEKAGQSADLATPDLKVQGKIIEDTKAAIAQKKAERDFTLGLIPALEAIKAKNPNNALGKSVDDTIADHRQQAARLASEIEDAGATIKAAQAKFSEVFISRAIETTKLLPGDAEWEKFATTYASNFSKAMADAGSLTQESAISVANNLSDQLNAAFEARKQGKIKLSLVDKTAFSQDIEFLKRMGLSVSALDTLLDGLNNTQNQNNANTYSAISATNELLKEYEATGNALDKLASAYVTLEKGQHLSLTQINELIKSSPSLLQHLKNEHGQLTFTKGAIKEVMTARAADLKLQAEAAIESAKQNKIRLDSELELAIKTIGLIKNVNQARKEGLGGLWTDFVAQNPDVLNSPGAMHAGSVITDKFGPLFKQLDDADTAMKGLLESANAIATSDLTGTAITNARDTGKGNKPTEPFKKNRFEHESLQLQRDLAIVDAEMQRLGKTDASYNDVLLRKIALMTRQRDIAHEEADDIRNVQIPAIEAKLAVESDPGDIEKLKKDRDELQKKILSLGQTWITVNGQIDSLKLGEPINQLDKAIETYELTVRSLADGLATLDNRQIGLATTSQAYRDNIEKQNMIHRVSISLGQDMLAQLQTEQTRLKQRLATEELTVEARKALEERLKAIRDRTSEINKELLSLDGTIKKNNQTLIDSEKEYRTKAEDLANKAIELYRKMAEERKKLELDAIDKLEKAEDERHKKEMDRLDEELSKYERIVNAKLKAIDREGSKDDFDRNLRKATDDRDKIQNQLNLLALDNSPEAKAKRAELEKQLLDANDKLEELKRNRSRDIRKEGLQDELDDFKKTKEAEKKTEDTNHKATMDGYKKQRDEIEATYQAAINNEELFSKIRKAAFEGDMNFIKTQLGEYFAAFETLAEKQMTSIGGKLKTQVDLANELKRLLQEAAQFKQDNPFPPSTGNNSGAGNGGSGGGAGGGGGRGPVAFDTGGYTGDNWPSPDGKLAFLHEKEQIFKADDTQRLLSVMNMTRHIMPVLRSIFSIPMPQTSTTGGPIGPIHNHFHNFKGTEKEAEFVSKAIFKKIANGIKKTGQG